LLFGLLTLFFNILYSGGTKRPRKDYKAIHDHPRIGKIAKYCKIAQFEQKETNI